jgi:hypothetical protein
MIKIHSETFTGRGVVAKETHEKFLNFIIFAAAISWSGRILHKTGSVLFAEQILQCLPIRFGRLVAGFFHASIAGENFLAQNGECRTSAGLAATQHGDQRFMEKAVHFTHQVPCALVGHAQLGRGGANRARCGDKTQQVGLARTKTMRAGMGKSQPRLQLWKSRSHMGTMTDRKARSAKNARQFYLEGGSHR